MTKNIIIAVLILTNIAVGVFAFSKQIEAEMYKEQAEQQTMIANKLQQEAEVATAKALKLWQESKAEFDSLKQAVKESEE